MRIEHKYIRNRAYKSKHWKRIRSQSHPYETLCPYSIDDAPNWYWIRRWDVEEQIKSHFEWIDKQARAIENGTHKHSHHAPKSFRQVIWNRRKSQERVILKKINNGNYDTDFPLYKKDADYDYF